MSKDFLIHLASGGGTQTIDHESLPTTTYQGPAQKMYLT